VGSSTFQIGQAQPRIEDLRFITGAGRFVDDIDVPAAAHMMLVRSPYAAAAIGSIDKSGAMKVPGVLAVLTAEDLIADGIGTLQTSVKRKLR